MKQHTITGSPKRCLNRNCKEPFTKESHLGYLMRSELEVYAVMRCTKCKDTFTICQQIGNAYEYYELLPKDVKISVIQSKLITKEEIRKVRKHLESDVKPFEELLKIMHPAKPPEEE
jgi:hypothetical protein